MGCTGYLVGVRNIDVVGGLVAGAIVSVYPFRGHVFWHLGEPSPYFLEPETIIIIAPLMIEPHRIRSVVFVVPVVAPALSEEDRSVDDVRHKQLVCMHALPLHRRQERLSSLVHEHPHGHDHHISSEQVPLTVSSPVV